MNIRHLKILVREIVKQAYILKNNYTHNKNTPVNYGCIFSKSKKEYDELLEVVKKIGNIIKETPTGPLFKIHPLDTVSGKLRLLKVRLPDSTRPERGDADFTISDYSKFKKKYLFQKGFKLIERENFEMIELIDSKFNVRAYFSHPPLDEQLGINKHNEDK